LLYGERPGQFKLLMGIFIRSASAAQAVGSISTPGGVSTSNSGAFRVSRSGTSINVGAALLTMEQWIRPSATDSDNGRTDVTAGANYSGVEGNIVMDGHSESSGAMIYGLDDGRFYFSVRNLGSGIARTIIGTTDLRDGAFHHTAVERNASTGVISVYVDGAREATDTGPTGDLSYPGGGGAQDAVLTWGKEKFEAAGAGFDGDISEIRVSTSLRYNAATYDVPTAPFTTDANTVGLYHLDDGAGTTPNDSSGDGNDGTLIGNPVPSWSTDDPF
jgi:hypothetical protein